MITYEKDINVNAIADEIIHVNCLLENGMRLKELLTSYMDKISTTINKMTNPINTDEIHSYLSSLKTNLDDIANVISSFNDLLVFLNELQEPIDLQILAEYNEYYKKRVSLLLAPSLSLQV